MQNGPFIEDLPLKTDDFHSYGSLPEAIPSITG